MERTIEGLHHVTAIAGDPQANIDFYTGVLGLRMVKQTVNYDDPGTYHLYYGNETGVPGTALTFFSWAGAAQGRRGAGQATATAFAVPSGSLTYWAERLKSYDVDLGSPEERFGSLVLRLTDHDGLLLELVEDASDDREPWTGGDVKGDHAIRGFHSVTLTEGNPAETGAMLEFLGYKNVGENGNRARYRVGDRPGGYIDIVVDPAAWGGRVARGSVHHIAFRTPSDEAQVAWLESLKQRRVGVSPVQDRQYFHSIYFREPGGVLFEIATDQPGFLADESVETLGSTLRLPSWLEPHRQEIEASLPPIKLLAA